MLRIIFRPAGRQAVRLRFVNLRLILVNILILLIIIIMLIINIVNIHSHNNRNHIHDHIRGAGCMRAFSTRGARAVRQEPAATTFSNLA